MLTELGSYKPRQLSHK